MFAFLLMLLAHPAWGHVVGISPWCLSYSSVHFECFYEGESSCRSYLKRLKDPFSDLNCAERPTDPALINAPDPKNWKRPQSPSH
jgi:hypothetical protein